MTLSPIANRELLVASRLRVTYWLRVGVALIAIALGVFIFWGNIGRPSQQVGVFLFRGLSGLCLIFCLLSGARSTADCVSVEKRQGTLGLLFLTDLKGYDVILGKLAATSLSGFYALLGVFPVLAVPLMMGGITYAEFSRMTLVLVNTSLFSLATGIFASTISREYRAAATVNVLLLALPTALIPGIAGWILAETSGRTVVRELLMGSPIYPFFLSFDFLYMTEKRFFWTSMAVIHGLTWLLVVLSSWIVPRVWQDRPVRTAKRHWRQRWRHGSTARREALRKRLLDINAFYWLASRNRLKRVSVWIGLGLMAGGWLWGLARFGAHDWLNAGMCVFFSILVSSVFLIWFGIESGERLTADRSAGALELLLSTPLTARDILRGQRLALQRQFLWPLVLVLVAGNLFMWTSVSQLPPGDLNVFLLLWPTGLFVFLLNIVALHWFGMYSALTARKPNHAAGTTLFLILFLPWVLIGGFAALVNVGIYMRWFPPPSWQIFFWTALGFIVLVNAGLGLYARHQLLTRIRLLPMKRMLRQEARARRRPIASVE